MKRCCHEGAEYCSNVHSREQFEGDKRVRLETNLYLLLRRETGVVGEHVSGMLEKEDGGYGYGFGCGCPYYHQPETCAERRREGGRTWASGGNMMTQLLFLVQLSPSRE